MFQSVQLKIAKIIIIWWYLFGGEVLVASNWDLICTMGMNIHWIVIRNKPSDISYSIECDRTISVHLQGWAQVLHYSLNSANVKVQDPPLTSTWDTGYAWKLKSEVENVWTNLSITGSDRNIFWCHQACLQYLHFNVNSTVLVVVEDSAWLCAVPNGYVWLRASAFPSHLPSRV
jgi:hypothetical protein